MAGIQRHLVQIQTTQSRTTVPPLNGCQSFAGHSLISKANAIAHTQIRPKCSRRRSKRWLTFITSPRPRGNETLSPGKATGPFPLLRYIATHKKHQHPLPLCTPWCGWSAIADGTIQTGSKGRGVGRGGHLGGGGTESGGKEQSVSAPTGKDIQEMVTSNYCLRQTHKLE